MFTPRRVPSTGSISKQEYCGLIPRSLLLSLVVVALLAFQVQGTAQIALPPPQVLENPDPKTDDFFGTSVSLSGGVMAVGSPGFTWPGLGMWQETVHLYELDPSTGDWIAAAIDPAISGSVPGEIRNPDCSPLPCDPTQSFNTNASDFGYSVSVSEDVLAVGAPLYWPGTGCVYLYERWDTGEWKPAEIALATAGPFPGQILNPYPSPGKFGWSVSVSGNLLVVGAPATSTFPNPQTSVGGVVWLFERNLATGKWDEVDTFVNPALQITDAFGTSVSVNDADPGFIGDVIAVGQNVGDGAVSLYERNQFGVWVAGPTITNPNSSGAAIGDRFGEDLSLFDGVLAIGAFAEDPNNIQNAGSVYLYERAPGPLGAAWNEAIIDLTISTAVQGEIPNPDPQPDDYFGISVSVWGDLLAVGEPGGFLSSSNTSLGAVHLFKRNQAGEWQPQVEVQHPNPGNNGDFGYSVAISSSRLAVADPTASLDNGTYYGQSGEAYIYQLEVEFRRGDCNNDGDINIADAVGALGILFMLGAPPDCLDACDANDDTTMNVADVVFTLAYLFSAGSPPPDPGPVNCGPDPTIDNLDCVSYDCL